MEDNNLPTVAPVKPIKIAPPQMGASSYHVGVNGTMCSKYLGDDMNFKIEGIYPVKVTWTPNPFGALIRIT